MALVMENGKLITALFQAVTKSTTDGWK
jgi:hypothetical protein